jgi:Ankyrin repeats (many copies)/Ankyrin repeat
MNSDLALRELVAVIVAGDAGAVTGLLAASPELAKASFQKGATRQSEDDYFLHEVRRYIYGGDTALHIAAAAYRPEIVRQLIAPGAVVDAKNRHGDEPIHAAAVGSPSSPRWNPPAQVASIESLIEAGADPNAVNKRGVSPLHVAVRTRSAAAVRTLLDHGADPNAKNKSGSTSMLLATLNTGRSGSGSPEAKAQQQEILKLLEGRESPVQGKTSLSG